MFALQIFGTMQQGGRCIGSFRQGGCIGSFSQGGCIGSFRQGRCIGSFREGGCIGSFSQGEGWVEDACLVCSGPTKSSRFNMWAIELHYNNAVDHSVQQTIDR